MANASRKLYSRLAVLLLVTGILVGPGSPAASSSAVFPDWCRASVAPIVIPRLPGAFKGDLTCSDIDNDGTYDLVVTATQEADVNVWQSTLLVITRPPDSAVQVDVLRSVNGVGSLLAAPFGRLGYVAKPVVADMDCDGFPDVVALRQMEVNETATIPSVAEVWWGSESGFIQCTQLSFEAGSLAYAQMCALKGDAEHPCSILVPLLSSNQIGQLQSTPQRQVSMEMLHRGLLPLSPMSVAAADLDNDGTEEILVAGYVPSAEGSVQRAFLALPVDHLVSVDTLAPSVYSEREAALAPLPIVACDLDGNGAEEILLTRRADKTEAERELPWATHEELIAAFGGAEGPWEIYPYPLWEGAASGVSVCKKLFQADGDTQVVLFVPDLGAEILTIRNLYVLGTCSIPQVGLLDGCVAESSAGHQLILLEQMQGSTSESRILIWKAE